MIGRISMNPCNELMVIRINYISRFPMELGPIPLPCNPEHAHKHSVACSLDFTQKGEKQLITITQILSRVGASLNILDLETLTWRNIYCNIKYRGTHLEKFSNFNLN